MAAITAALIKHTMEMARPVVRRGRRKETTSCEIGRAHV